MGSFAEAANKTTVNVLLGGTSYISVLTSPLPLPPDSSVSGQVAASPAAVTPFDENQLFDIGSATVAFVLTVLMSIGIGLNCVLLLIVILHPRARQLVNAFIGHNAAISVLKCVFCIVFATSLTTRFEAALCDKIGGSYVVLTSVEVFNLLAMVCAEAYFFGQANVGRDGRGSCCCVMIGLFLIYLGSVILHLGPTIIAGGIGYNRTAGSCIFGFKSIQSYVAHAIWIVITTLGVTAVLYYLSVVYREVQSCRPHRIASLVRASVPTTTRNQNTVDQLTVKRIVSDSQRRAVVLILVTCTFVVTSYPLFLLTLFDLGFSIEGSIYRIFTFFSWTNTLINPLLFLLVDRKFGLVRLLKPCGSSRLSRGSDASIVSSTRPPNYVIGSTSPTNANTVANGAVSPSSPVPGDRGATNERTGLLSKSNDRLQNYELREEPDMNLGCSGNRGAKLVKQGSMNAASQPPILDEWQNRVGGRLYLQGELITDEPADDSVMMMDGPSPGTVIIYDAYNNSNAAMLAADDHQLQPRSSAVMVGDYISAPGGQSTIQMVPCFSSTSLTTSAAPGTNRPTYVVHNTGAYGNAGVVIGNVAAGSIKRSSAQHQQQQPTRQQLYSSLSNEYMGPSTSSPPSNAKRNQQQQQQQQFQQSSMRIYRPQSVMSAINAIDGQATAIPSSSMVIMTQQQQQQQQQQHQQMRQQQQMFLANQQRVMLPQSMRVVANAANNISFRQMNNNNSRLPVATTASFIGTEDSLEEIIYCNSNDDMYRNSNQTFKRRNTPYINNFNINNSMLDDDDETTC